MGAPEEIYVLDQKVRLLQPGKGFRTSLDSVMLAAACPVQAGQRVLDLGCGVGAVGFCILNRVPGAFLTGVDIQPEYIALANENIALNQAEGHIEFVVADIGDYRADARFDHVVCNPPYLEAGQHTPSPERGLAIARGKLHGEEGLPVWIDAAFHNLKSGGSFTIIHRADALDRILRALGRRFGAVEIIPLWPRQGEAAKRVIVRAAKDRKTPASIHPGLVLHKADGAYTEAADAILRGTGSLLT